MKTVPREYKTDMIETRPQPQAVAAASLAWKGTVLLVGMISLLVLLSGCYTVIATGSSGRLLDRYSVSEYEPWDEPVEEEAGGGVFLSEEAYQLDQEALLLEEPEGVGVRYRRDYTYDLGAYEEYVYDEELDAVVASYRRPWLRRLYVDYYNQVSCPWYYRPRRLGSVWSAGWLWGGFCYSFGWYEPYWYDPFYWDWWWCDPFYYYQPCFSWYSWRWSYVHAGWYWPYHYYDHWYYDPFFYDPYWYGPYRYYDSYWYPGGGRGAVVSRNYERRPADRRRGLADARQARDGEGASATSGARSARGRATTADSPLTDSRRRTDRSGAAGTGTRTDARGSSRTRQGNSGSSIGGTKVRAVPPIKEGVVGGVQRMPTRRSTQTAPSAAKNRISKPKTSSSTTSRILRTLGTILNRATSSSRARSSSRSRTSSSSGRTSTSRPPPRTTTSRPPPRTTTSRPPPRTSSAPRTTTSRIRTSTSVPRTSSRPPRTTSSRPPRTTTSRPPPRTSSAPRTTTSRVRTSTSSGRTSSRPPRTTTSRPPPSASSGGAASQKPAVVTTPSGLVYYSRVPVPVYSNMSGGNVSRTGSSARGTSSYTSRVSTFSQSSSFGSRSVGSFSGGMSSRSSSMSSGSRAVSSGARTMSSRSRSSVSSSRTRRPPR